MFMNGFKMKFEYLSGLSSMKVVREFQNLFLVKVIYKGMIVPYIVRYTLANESIFFNTIVILGNLNIFRSIMRIINLS